MFFQYIGYKLISIKPYVFLTITRLCSLQVFWFEIDLL